MSLTIFAKSLISVSSEVRVDRPDTGGSGWSALGRAGLPYAVLASDRIEMQAAEKSGLHDVMSQGAISILIQRTINEQRKAMAFVGAENGNPAISSAQSETVRQAVAKEMGGWVMALLRQTAVGVCNSSGRIPLGRLSSIIGVWPTRTSRS
jgi:hypothetical protein